MNGKKYHVTMLLLIGLTGFLVNCSHNERYEYTKPDLYEPVYLTSSSEIEYQTLQTEAQLYESLDRNFNGNTDQEYHSGVIQNATLSPADQFLAAEGFPTEALTGNYGYQHYSDDVVVSSHWIEANEANPYIYEWAEWRNVRHSSYYYPQSITSYHFYTSYNPYDPYWFDPYWSYTRLRSYHAPFHPAYRYGGSLAFGYWHYPYYRYPYYYYPHHPRNQRESYTTQDTRERRTGIQRNPSPHLSPAGYTSFSSALRSRSTRTIAPPSADRIFTSPQREAASNLRRETLIPTGRSNSIPRIQIQTNQRSQSRMPRFESNRSPVSPSVSTQSSRSIRQSSGQTSSPRR